MAGCVEQGNQPKESEERTAKEIRLILFRTIIRTMFLPDNEERNDQDEEIADADLLHRRNFPAHADNHLHGRKGKCGQDHKEDALLFLCDIHDVLLKI